MVIKMAKPLGRPILKKILQIGYNNDEMSKPKAKGTRKFLAMIMMKTNEMINSKK